MNYWLPLVCLLPSAVAMLWLTAQSQWFWAHREELNFGYWVPVLCAYVFWRAWATKPPVQYRWTWSGRFFAISGAVILFIVQIYQAAFGMMAAGVLVLAMGVYFLVAANLHFVFGWRGVRHFAFSFLVFITALPMPSAIQNLAVLGLRNLVTALNVEFLNFIGIPANGSGSVIQIANGVVGIDDACSGIIGFRVCIMLTFFLGHIQLRFLMPLLILLGVGWSVLGNIFRTFVLCYIMHAKGTEAVNAWHDSAAFTFMIFSVLGVFLTSWALKKVEDYWMHSSTTLPPQNKLAAHGM